MEFLMTTSCHESLNAQYEENDCFYIHKYNSPAADVFTYNDAEQDFQKQEPEIR